MTDSLEEYEYGRLSLSPPARPRRDTEEGFFPRGSLTNNNNNNNINGSVTGISPLPTPKMGFRAYQAAMRENPDLLFSPSSQPSAEDASSTSRSFSLSPLAQQSAYAQAQESEEEAFQLTHVTIYDSTNAASTILRMNRRLTSREVCRALAQKMDLSKDEALYHTLVVVITVYDAEKRGNVHCVRTFQSEEIVLNALDLLVAKLTERYKVLDVTRMKNTIRWFFKDVRTPPIEFPEEDETTGEDSSSEDEEEVSHSDLAYLAKAERKGYLLKRSSRDQNLWRKWYCVLTDHLWCINIRRKTPTAICVRLSGMVCSSRTHNKQQASYNNRASRSSSTTFPSFTGSSTSDRLSVSNAGSSLNTNINNNNSNQAPSSSSSYSNSNNNSNNANSAGDDKQLYSIVIHSPRGAHLLRAFSLPDQQCWIEDLLAKTQCALENDYFNMAEVIICDEESSKSKRIHKAVEELLEVSPFFDALSLDLRAVQTSSAREYHHHRSSSALPLPVIRNTNTDNVTSSASVDTTQLSKHSSQSTAKLTEHSNSNDSDNDTVDESESEESSESSSGTDKERVKEDKKQLTDASSSLSHLHTHTLSLASSRRRIHPMDRTLQSSSIHRIYDRDALFTHLLRLSLDTLHYKELFRHDLFILPAYQRQIAVYIFAKYLLPIIQVQRSASFRTQQQAPTPTHPHIYTKGEEEDEVDMKQIAAAVQLFSARAMRSNGFIQDERELQRFLANAQRVLEKESSIKSVAISPSKKSSTKSDHNGDGANDNTSTAPPLPPLQSPTYSSYSSANSSSFSSASSPTNPLGLLWDIPHESLLHVYRSLFAPAPPSSLQISPLSLTGTTNADRWTASGTEQRDEALSPTSNNKQGAGSAPLSSSAPSSSSFWSWFGAAPAAPSSPEVSDFRGNKSRAEMESDIAFPTQDLFDPVLEELRKLLRSQR